MYWKILVDVMPRYEISVASAIKARHTTMLIQRTSAIDAIAGFPAIMLIDWKSNSTAMPARFESTSTVSAMRSQPAIQPTQGPNARVAQVKEVPESGIAEFNARYPSATRS